jgi:hypothetical protein
MNSSSRGKYRTPKTLKAQIMELARLQTILSQRKDKYSAYNPKDKVKQGEVDILRPE